MQGRKCVGAHVQSTTLTKVPIKERHAGGYWVSFYVPANEKSIEIK